MGFEPGNKCAAGGAREGSGRKPDELRREMQQLFAENCGYEERGQIVDMMKIAARCGNVKAANFIFDRFYGKSESVDTTQLVSRLQAFMETVVTVITQEVDPQTRERILTRLQQAGLDPDTGHSDSGA